MINTDQTKAEQNFIICATSMRKFMHFNSHSYPQGSATKSVTRLWNTRYVNGGKTSGVARISSRRGPNFMGTARYPTYPVTSLVTLRSLKVFPRQFLKVYQMPLELCLLCALFFCFCITLARTSFFTKREHTWRGGGHPRAISLLGVIELRDKDQRIAWDVPNLIVCELTYLGQPLTFQIR